MLELEKIEIKESSAKTLQDAKSSFEEQLQEIRNKESTIVRAFQDKETALNEKLKR